MPDTVYDPGGLNYWSDVPAEYYTNGVIDYSQFGSPSPYVGYEDFSTPLTPGLSSGEEEWFYDTQTGQVITAAQAKAIDPVGWDQWLKYGVGAVTGLAGLGTLGAAAYSLFGGSDPENRTTQQTSTTAPGGLSPQALQLLTGGGGAAGGGAPGGGVGGMLYDTQTGQYVTAEAAQRLDPSGYANYTSAFGTGTGLMGLAGAGAESVGGPGGLMNQQQQILGALPANIPALNPAITQAIGANALGMSQGMLPALADPNIQQRIAQVYQPGFDALNYTAGQALDQAQQQLQQRGFEAPDIREGPTQALTAPILAAQELGRSQLYGQMAGSQLDLASRLPMQGSQLAAQQYALQSQPFGLGLQAVNAFNQPIMTQGQMPLSLFDILSRNQGATQTVNTVGPQPSLTQQIGQVAPMVGAAGSLLGSAGSTLFPQQNSNMSGFLFNPYTGGPLYG